MTTRPACMSRPWRARNAQRLLAVSLLLITALTVLSPANAAAPGTSSQAGAGSTAATLEEMATCLRSRGRLLLVLLMDESGSLRSTDPTNERVTAARLALRSFASLSSTRVAGKRPRVDVLVAAFSSGFTTVTPWTSLDDRHLSGIEQSVEGFASRNSGLDTDFPTAFLGAQQELATRSARLSERASGESCKAILLFTDGRYDVQTGDTPARRQAGTEKSYAPGVSLLDPANGAVVEAAGRDLLCRTDGTGLVDRLRGDGAAVVTVALAAQIDTADQDFLVALSTGSAAGGTVTCGSASGAENGAYLAATELSDLAPAFARVATSIAGATEAPGAPVVEACAESQCDRGRRRFDLDPLLRRFTMLADTSAGGVVMQLKGPRTTDPLVLASDTDGKAVVSGARVEWAWLTKTTVEVNAELPGTRDDWVGQWSATFVDPTGSDAQARPRADVFLYGGWTPSLPVSAELLRGEPAELVVVVTDADAKPVSRATLQAAKATLEASLTDPTTHATERVPLRGPDDEGRFHAAYTADAQLRASALQLDLRLIARTRRGVELAPSTARYQLTVALPDLYPHVKTSTLRLTSVRGTGNARGTIEVVGGRDRPGCVWFDPPAFASYPSEAGTFTAKVSPRAAKDDCLKIVAGETRRVAVEISPSNASEGAVRGTIVASVSARGESKALSVVIPFSFDVAPPIDQARRVGLFLAILLPGVLAPIAALMLINRRLARFEPPCRVLVARVPVSTERTVHRVLREYAGHDGAGLGADGPEPRAPEDLLTLDPTAFVPLGREHRRVREIAYGDLDLSARAPLNPFGEPYGRISCARQCAAGGPHRTSSDPQDRLPLALPGSWIYVLCDESAGTAGTAGTAASPPRPAGALDAVDAGRWISGELIVFLADGLTEEHLPALNASLRERLSIVANDLASNHGTRRKT